ncbi:MAG: tetratricopeptide repeat protein, partial [Gammaproteobacteria bacterium]|nr:tetratricopeptide repeat protein [Gammaproteobacteria bacterium]
GLYFRRMLSADRVNKGIKYFKMAIKKDPDYALAYAGLAYAYMVLTWYAAVPPEENYQKAKQAALKALKLDDHIAEAHESLAAVSGYLEGNWESAKKEIKRAIELNPGYAWGYFHLATILAYQAKHNESIKEMQRALELDPLNVAFNRGLGVAYFHADQLENAIEILQRTIEMDPTFPVTHLYLGYAYMQKSMYEEALAQMQKETLPKAMLDPQIGIVYARMGRRKEALQILNKYMGQSNKEFIHHYGMACLYFALAENDLGFQWLEKAYEARDPWIVSIKIDFLLDGVRTDPRFKALLKKIGLEK